MKENDLLSLPVVYHEKLMGAVYLYDIVNQSYGYVKVHLIPVVVAAGGLITGFIIYTFDPSSEGHGTDAAIRAFHYTHKFTIIYHCAPFCPVFHHKFPGVFSHVVKHISA